MASSILKNPPPIIMPFDFDLELTVKFDNTGMHDGSLETRPQRFPIMRPGLKASMTVDIATYTPSLVCN